MGQKVHESFFCKDLWYTISSPGECVFFVAKDLPRDDATASCI